MRHAHPMARTFPMARTLQVMMLIVNGDPATLEAETAATPAFHDFLRVALVKDPATRPSAAQLLEHEWITSATRPALAELVAEQEEALKQAVRSGGGSAEDGGEEEEEIIFDHSRRSSGGGEQVATMKL